jgi:UDP-N-acetylmuramyl tripeptide synthase
MPVQAESVTHAVAHAVRVGDEQGAAIVMDFREATVIVDYGHNPDAMRAPVRAVEAMPLGEGCRRSVVISGAGDRRDQDRRAQTAILGAAFDLALDRLCQGDLCLVLADQVETSLKHIRE